MLRIVSQTSGRAFCRELCRDDEWIDICINYTLDIFNGATQLKKWHPWLRPLVYKFVPELGKVHTRKKRAVQMVDTVLTARNKQAELDGENYVKPVDMLQWLSEKMPDWETEVSVTHITDLQLILGFASIHSNTGTLTNILYDLVARPEYFSLREEIGSVLQRHNGEFTRHALDQMWNLDSFMKESMRFTPTNKSKYTLILRNLSRYQHPRLTQPPVA